MQALLVNPMENPYIIEVNNTLEDLQNAVGGDIQIVYPWNDMVALVCNEEGKINGMPLNRVLYSEDGSPYDVIAGSFLIVGIDEKSSDLTNIPKGMIKKYTELFKNRGINFNDAKSLFGTYGVFSF